MYDETHDDGDDDDNDVIFLSFLFTYTHISHTLVKYNKNTC